jgi:hypothetical protein
MPFVDTNNLNVIERLPGWYGRYFHSMNMTFAHYDFKRAASIHEHSQEEVYEVIEGELERILGIEALSQTALEPPGGGPPDLPVPAARCRDRAA